MNVGVAYADKFKQIWLKLDVPEGSTVGDAIEKVGLFSKLTKLDVVLEEGTRVEIDRPITADPKIVERRDIE